MAPPSVPVPRANPPPRPADAALRASLTRTVTVCALASTIRGADGWRSGSHLGPRRSNHGRRPAEREGRQSPAPPSLAPAACQPRASHVPAATCLLSCARGAHFVVLTPSYFGIWSRAAERVQLNRKACTRWTRHDSASESAGGRRWEESKDPQGRGGRGDAAGSLGTHGRRDASGAGALGALS